MTGKHTPGPWTVETDILRNGHLAIVAEDYGIAKVWNTDIGNNCHVDARLIAAAPDMLAALKSARASMGANAARDAVDAAIAKAEGR